MTYYTLHTYQDRQKKWRWTLLAGNGKKVACSGEGYSRRIDCTKIAKKLFPWLSVSEGA
jgi:uncharacterized protein YegP (UPF0339 family)